MPREKLRDLECRKARLRTSVETAGGVKLRKGSVYVIDSFWRGRVTLAYDEPPAPGYYSRRIAVRHLHRGLIEVLDAA